MSGVVTVRVDLRLPDELHAALKAAAVEGGRTLHGEVLWRLRVTEPGVRVAVGVETERDAGVVAESQEPDHGRAQTSGEGDSRTNPRVSVSRSVSASEPEPTVEGNWGARLAANQAERLRKGRYA